MDKLNETISKLEEWIDDQNAMNTEIDACLVADALELLKEKQPRVLTLEEVKQAEVVWCEWGCVEGYVNCMLFDKIDPDGDYRLIESNGGGLYYSASEYNESWRCWSASPTDEQMKVTEWDGDGE